MAHRFLVGVLFLFLFPFSLASFVIDCSQVSGELRGECQKVLTDGSLDAGQKEELYLSLLMPEGKIALYDFLWNWNNKQQLSSPPIGAETKSDGIIRGAWVKVVSIDKSYLDLNSNEWFVQPFGRVLSAYAYSINVPSGTAPGDCATNYSYKILTENLAQELNGNSIGSQKVSLYSTDVTNGGEMNFLASLGVSALLTIDHYKTRQHCRPDDEDKCTSSCDYDSTEQQQSSVNATDTFPAKVKSQEIGFTGFLERNPGISKIRIDLVSPRPINGFELKSGDNVFRLSESSFDVARTIDGVLFVTKNYGESRKFKGFFDLNSNVSGEVRQIVLGTTKPGPCTYSVYSDFGEKESDCALKELAPASLSVGTDANHFDGNESAGVTIKLSGVDGAPIAGEKVSIDAGGKIQKLTTNNAGLAETSVSAGGSKGLVSASFAGNDDYAEAVGAKRFSIGNPIAWDEGGEVVGFFGAYYLVFLIGKKLLLGAL